MSKPRLLDLFYNMSMDRNQAGQFMKGTNGNTFEGFGIWYDTKGYPCIWIDNKGIRLHVYIWEKENGRKPKGYDVHHKDLDRLNYNISNLELLSFSDHSKVHAGWIKANGEWVANPCTRCGKLKPLSEFYLRKGYTPTALCKSCQNIVTSARNKTIPEKRRLYNQRWYAKKKGVMPNAKE